MCQNLRQIYWNQGEVVAAFLGPLRILVKHKNGNECLCYAKLKYISINVYSHVSTKLF